MGPSDKDAPATGPSTAQTGLEERLLEVPVAWREALADATAVDRELAARVPELLEPASELTPGLERLLKTVAAPPWRYAPFFARIGALWDLPEERVEAALATTGDLAAWKRTPLPGVRVIEVTAGPRAAGAETFLVRFAPGTRFPRHRHPGPESLLVLQGSYTDTNGVTVGPGDLHEMAPATEHGFLVAQGEPCIGAALQYGREFTGPFMKMLALLFDRKSA